MVFSMMFVCVHAKDDVVNLQLRSMSYVGPEQAIFCGVTSVRLSSNGKFNNNVVVSIRKADENDLSAATLICDI